MIPLSFASLDTFGWQCVDKNLVIKLYCIETSIPLPSDVIRMILRTILETVSVLHAAGISHCSLHPDNIYIHSCYATPDENGAVVCAHDCDFDGKLHRGTLGPNLFVQISNLEYSLDSATMFGTDTTYIQELHDKFHPYWSSPELCLLALKPRSKLRKRNFRDSSGKTDVWSVGMLALTLIERIILMSPQYIGTKDSSSLTNLKEHSVKQVSRFTSCPRIASLRKWTTLAQDFVFACLRPNHVDRPTAANAAKHPFLVANNETVLVPLSDISESETSNLDDTYEDETTYIPAPDSDSLGGSSEASFWSDEDTVSHASQYVATRSNYTRSRGNSSSIEADMEVSSDGSTGSVKIIKQTSEDEAEFFHQPPSAAPNPKFSSTRRRGKSESVPEAPADMLDRTLRGENPSPPVRQGRTSPGEVAIRDGIQDGSSSSGSKLNHNAVIGIHGKGSGSLPSSSGNPLVSFPSDTPDSSKESSARKWAGEKIVTTPPPVRHIRHRTAVISSASSSSPTGTPVSNSLMSSAGASAVAVPSPIIATKDASPIASPAVGTSPVLQSHSSSRSGSGLAAPGSSATMRPPRDRTPSPVRRGSAAPAPTHTHTHPHTQHHVPPTQNINPSTHHPTTLQHHAHPLITEPLRRSSMPLLPITDLARSPSSGGSQLTPVSAGSDGSSGSRSPGSARLSQSSSNLLAHAHHTSLPPHHFVVSMAKDTISIPTTTTASPGSSPGGAHDPISSYGGSSSLSSHGSSALFDETSKSSKDSSASAERLGNKVSLNAPLKTTLLADGIERANLLNRSMRSRSEDVLFDKEPQQVQSTERRFSVVSTDSYGNPIPSTPSSNFVPPSLNWNPNPQPAPVAAIKMQKSPSGNVISGTVGTSATTSTPPSSAKTTPRKKVKRTKSGKEEEDVIVTTQPFDLSLPQVPPVRTTSPADPRRLVSLDDALAKEIKEVETKWNAEIRKRIKTHESREKEWVEKWSTKMRNVKKRYDVQVGALGKREETRMAEFKRMVTEDKTRLFQEHQREIEREDPTGRRNSVAAYATIHKHVHTSSEGGGKNPLFTSSNSGTASPSAAPSSPSTPHNSIHSGMLTSREAKKTQFGKREVHLNHEKLIYEMDRKHVLERYDLELKLLDEADAIDRDYEVQKLIVKQSQLEALHDAQRNRLEEIFALKTKMNDEIKSMMRKYVARKLKKLTEGDNPSGSRRGSSEFSSAQMSALLGGNSAPQSSGNVGNLSFAASSQASPPNPAVVVSTSSSYGSQTYSGGGGASPNAGLPSPRFFGDMLVSSPASSNPLAQSGSASYSQPLPYSPGFGMVSVTQAIGARDWWSQFADLSVDALLPPIDYSLVPMEKFHRAVELSEWKQSEALAVLSRDLALAEAHKAESAELFERQAHELDVVRASFEMHYVRSRQTFVSERLQRASRYELELLDLKYAYLKRQVSKSDEEAAMNEIRDLEAQREFDRSNAFANFESWKDHLLRLAGAVAYSAFSNHPPLAKDEMAQLITPQPSSSAPYPPSIHDHGSPPSRSWTGGVMAPPPPWAGQNPMTPSSSTASVQSLPGNYSPSRSSLDLA